VVNTAVVTAVTEAGATLVTETWDEALPARPSPECAGRYRTVSVDLYAREDDAKLERLLDALERADYVVLASQRQYGALGRLPEGYPLASAYYRLLLGERLGFRLVETWTNYPRLGPAVIVDEPLAGTDLPRPTLLGSTPGAVSWRGGQLLLQPGRADESYSVYDHPRVLVFRKEEGLSREELRALLVGGP
ncbi:MAG: hypothetical protein QME94_06100, partial [Anaerolineae bacterium]|nr:hypothetical protein [Anaerolineae bacterium]